MSVAIHDQKKKACGRGEYLKPVDLLMAKLEGQKVPIYEYRERHLNAILIRSGLADIQLRCRPA